MRYVIDAIRINLRAAMQYRASFLLQTLSQLIMTAGDLLAVLVLMDRFGHIGRWSPPEILLFFGAMQWTFALTEILDRGLCTFSTEVRRGTFDAMLVRPRSPLKQVILSRLDPRRIGTMLVGLAAVLLATRTLGLTWTWDRVLLLLWSSLGTVALLMGLFLVEASVTFFTVQGLEAVNVLTYGGRQTCQYPVDVFPGPIRLLFLYVAPIALTLHLPLGAILGKPVLPWPAWAVWVSPCAGFAFFGLVTLLWRLGVRRYQSAGS
jgi:ABC-2 type transport system permease protein